MSVYRTPPPHKTHVRLYVTKRVYKSFSYRMAYWFGLDYWRERTQAQQKALMDMYWYEYHMTIKANHRYR